MAVTERPDKRVLTPEIVAAVASAEQASASSSASFATPATTAEVPAVTSGGSATAPAKTASELAYDPEARAQKQAERAAQRKASEGVDGMDGVGGFLRSTNNYEKLLNAEFSVPGLTEARAKAAAPGAKKADKNALTNLINTRVRPVMGPVVNEVFGDGARAGETRDTYQSSFDKGGDFGAENAIEGVYGDRYVLHGHYGADGHAHTGSMGVKLAANPFESRLAHGITDAAAPASDELSNKRLLDQLPGMM